MKPTIVYALISGNEVFRWIFSTDDRISTIRLDNITDIRDFNAWDDEERAQEYLKKFPSELKDFKVVQIKITTEVNVEIVKNSS